MLVTVLVIVLVFVLEIELVFVLVIIAHAFSPQQFRPRSRFNKLYCIDIDLFTPMNEIMI